MTLKQEASLSMPWATKGEVAGVLWGGGERGGNEVREVGRAGAGRGRKRDLFLDSSLKTSRLRESKFPRGKVKERKAESVR